MSETICDRCDERVAVVYAPEYGANFCGPCAADPQKRDVLSDRSTPERFSIRWTYEGYKVSVPNYDGGEVVPAGLFDRLRAEVEHLREAGDAVISAWDAMDGSYARRGALMGAFGGLRLALASDEGRRA
jgi:hypothetical protein